MSFRIQSLYSYFEKINYLNFGVILLLSSLCGEEIGDELRVVLPKIMPTEISLKLVQYSFWGKTSLHLKMGIETSNLIFWKIVFLNETGNLKN